MGPERRDVVCLLQAVSVWPAGRPHAGNADCSLHTKYETCTSQAAGQTSTGSATSLAWPCVLGHPRFLDNAGRVACTADICSYELSCRLTMNMICVNHRCSECRSLSFNSALDLHLAHEARGSSAESMPGYGNQWWKLTLEVELSGSCVRQNLGGAICLLLPVVGVHLDASQRLVDVAVVAVCEGNTFTTVSRQL